jgi:toxin ParE1/3/4
VTLWLVRLAAPAEADLISIVGYTVQSFGASQAEVYRDLILASVRQLEAGPDIPGARPRPELGLQLHSLQVSRGRNRGRHILLYRPAGGQLIEILRILHQSMDLERHVP